VLKLSPGKATLPAAKQVWRRLEGGRFTGDVVALRDENAPAAAEPLLEPVMANGVRVADQSLGDARARAAQQRSALSPEHRLLDATPYPVELGIELAALRDELAGSLSP
jgi:nicotinate phosphoribosyltransferase